MSELDYNSWHFPPARQKITSRCCCVFVSFFVSPDRLSSSQRCRVKCEDQGRRSVCVWGAGGEDHPDARLVAEREARPGRPAQRRRRRRWNMWRLLFSGLDRTNMLSFTHTFNRTHVKTTCSHTYKHTHTPSHCVLWRSEGPHTLPLSTHKLQFAQLRITALRQNADAVQPCSQQTEWDSVMCYVFFHVTFRTLVKILTILMQMFMLKQL